MCVCIYISPVCSCFKGALSLIQKDPRLHLGRSCHLCSVDDGQLVRPNSDVYMVCRLAGQAQATKLWGRDKKFKDIRRDR